MEENNYYITKIEKKDGIFKREDGTEIKYKNYYVYFKRENNPLEMRAKVDKVFNDYVENNDDAE